MIKIWKEWSFKYLLAVDDIDTLLYLLYTAA